MVSETWLGRSPSLDGRLAEGASVLNFEHQARSIPTGLRILAQGFRTLGQRQHPRISTLKGLRP